LSVQGSCQKLDRIAVAFDEDRAIPNAGLLLPATLCAHLGLHGLFERFLRVTGRGRANTGVKMMTLIMSVLAGGDCIDDANALRAGGTVEVLGHGIRAASTLGTFLRCFTFGNVAQLGRVSGEAFARAWRSGAGPGGAPVVIDIDSTICETYGLHKIGGSKFGYTHVRGYHPLLAVVAGFGDVIHSRLRGGPAHTGRNAASFITETIRRLRHADAAGPVVVRADSGYYSRNVVDACTRAGVAFSITVRHNNAVQAAISQIPDDAWTPIPYWCDGGAEVAETRYSPFALDTPVRLVVRRVSPSPGSQLALLTEWSYHAFITDRPGPTLDIEADHRRHAEIENTIRDLKYGVGLNHMPSGRFDANAAWLEVNILAHNIARWSTRIGALTKDTAWTTTKTLRRRYLNIPGRMTRSGRRDKLHLVADWPWADQFLEGLNKLRAIPQLN
jgi:hypothetical protein